MSKLLTAKDVQNLLQVDRSTVYRMAEDGRLPAIKVGKQWRFQADQIETWFGEGITAVSESNGGVESAVSQNHTSVLPESDDLCSLLPLECVQLIQNSHAQLLGVMLVITDMQGNPITQPSNPCGLFQSISEIPDAVQKCIHSWHDLANILSFEPQFYKTHLNMLCARGLIRVGAELKGMVIAGCVAPQDWPPSPAEVVAMAAEFDVAPELIAANVNEAYQLDAAQKEAALQSLPQVANIIAHIVKERQLLVGKLNAISALANL